MRLLTGSARLAGVIGWPVAHSKSPRIHGTWLERYGIDGAYVPMAVRPEDFETVVRGLAAAGFAGVNVTLPHKAAAFALADELTPAARRAGAVNTTMFREAKIIGDNTDGAGFIANLWNHNAQFWRVPTLILGAGGAARAIAAALQDEGNAVTICNRTPERAQSLADQLGANVLPWDDRAAELGNFGLLVNTTSLGMVNHPPLDMRLDRAKTKLIVADIVYNPIKTQLLADAYANGHHAVEGLGMLLHQAVPGFEAWFGKKPEVDAALYAIAMESL
jgi:shikimate dehydrogenase